MYEINLGSVNLQLFVACTVSVYTYPTNAVTNPQLFQCAPQSGFVFNTASSGGSNLNIFRKNNRGLKNIRICV